MALQRNELPSCDTPLSNAPPRMTRSEEVARLAQLLHVELG